MSRADRAEELFRQGYNCGQSVFAAFADVLGMSVEEAAKIASPFGAGFGKLREVCGAVSGMTLVTGYLKGYSDPADYESKKEVYALHRCLQDSSGDSRERDTVKSMKTINVVAAIIVKDGKIFATQRGYGDYKDWWEFPGGKIEPGETPEDALRREIREELHAEIEVGRLVDTVEYDYPKFHMVMRCYLCRLISEKIELVEHEAARWLSTDDVWSVKWLPSDIEVIENLFGGQFCAE